MYVFSMSRATCLGVSRAMDLRVSTASHLELSRATDLEESRETNVKVKRHVTIVLDRKLVFCTSKIIFTHQNCEYSFRRLTMVIATGFIPLSTLSVVPKIAMWESSQWLGKNIVQSTD